MSSQATIYGVISTLEKYSIEDAKRILFQMVQEMEHGDTSKHLLAQQVAAGGPYKVIHISGTSVPWGVAGTNRQYRMRANAAEACNDLNAAWSAGRLAAPQAGVDVEKALRELDYAYRNALDGKMEPVKTFILSAASILRSRLLSLGEGKEGK